MDLHEITKKYSREEVLAIVKSFEATTEDYLIQTYFKIFKITGGPLYLKFERRFNNIIFNNFPTISQNLTLTIFRQKAKEILKREIASVKYFSCIYLHKLAGNPPIFLQYFNKDSGLDQRLVGFTTSSSLTTVLGELGVIEKIVGFCGDFCYIDPSDTNLGSDQIKSLRLLSGQLVIDLPYSDGFIDRLFDVLVSYLPEDLVKALESIGDTMMGLNSNSRFADELVSKYRQWKMGDGHILASDYAEFVVNNYSAINAYMEPFHCLPRFISSLLSSIFHRFLLFFIKELYQKVDRIKLSDNNAVVYYFYLVRIRDLFKSYEENHYIPSRAYRYINTEIDAQIDNEQLDPEQDESIINKLTREVVLEVDYTYARAVRYMKPLIQVLETHFENCSWFLLTEPINPDEIHLSYHKIKNNDSCESCRDLLEEVKIVNSLVPRIPILDIVRVEAKWLRVLKECDVPIIEDLVEFLFSLPAYKVRDVEGGDIYQCAESIIRDSLKNVSPESVVESVGDFFWNRIREARAYVEVNKVPLLTD